MESSSCKVDNQGRITLPVDWRAAHNLRAGSEVVVTAEQDHLRIQTREQNLTEAQQIVAKFRRPGRSAVEQLLADRRRDAKKELRDSVRHAKGL